VCLKTGDAQPNSLSKTHFSTIFDIYWFFQHYINLWAIITIVACCISLSLTMLSILSLLSPSLSLNWMPNKSTLMCWEREIMVFLLRTCGNNSLVISSNCKSDIRTGWSSFSLTSQLIELLYHICGPSKWCGHLYERTIKMFVGTGRDGHVEQVNMYCKPYCPCTFSQPALLFFFFFFSFSSRFLFFVPPFQWQNVLWAQG